MKIAVISPNASSLKEMGKILSAFTHSATFIEGGKSKMRIVAEQEQPDLMLVEGMCCDPSELAQVEYITTHHPGIAVILLCAIHTPEFLINSMRAGVREVLPSPVTASALEAAVSRIAAKCTGSRGKPQGRILAFMPCKGGSGATFLATNLGYQLAQSKSVLLIDLNLQFGEALSFVHDGEPASTLADVVHDISRLDATFLAASTVKVAPNYSILAAPEDPAQAMEVKPEHIDPILNLAAMQYDFILLDVGRNLDTLTIKALDRADRIFPVLQAGLPYLRNAGKLLAIFKSLGYPSSKVELIINRFEKSGEIGIENMRRSLGAITLHTVPNSYKEVNASINHGDPMIAMARSNAVTKNLAAFALTLSPREEESRGLLGRLFRRA
ncbi:Type II/IV secretion system ATPase TadZ/CpaE [Collimonas arenae]|uniref:Type II/IV secretion system ATPase TadZ/CpaE n=1 Tax=Collimonas arenae TaxID=279058 RepID=A0A0A1FJ89_9BURK|nr:AAA family ATPase [Collimonas arenae]AIY42967.1 Type II/IV secretion system ATPase TadZ/CpaE [Collimonas arenae]